jgi:hypothetical protein
LFQRKRRRRADDFVVGRREVRATAQEYLTTALALADDNVRQAPTDLLTDPGRASFAGPYPCTRTPHQPLPEGWESPLS